MSITIPKVVSFGKSKSNLSGVGFTLLNPNGSIYQARTTSGVYEINGGSYGAEITFPDNWIGIIQWDTGMPSPVYAVEEYILGGEIINLDADVSLILEDTSEIQSKLPDNYIMGSTNKTNKDDEIDDILNSSVMTG